MAVTPDVRAGRAAVQRGQRCLAVLLPSRWSAFVFSAIMLKLVYLLRGFSAWVGALLIAATAAVLALRALSRRIGWPEEA